MRERHSLGGGSTGRSRSGEWERGSTQVRKQMVVSSDTPQNYYPVSPDLFTTKKSGGGVPMKCLIEEELVTKEKKTRHPSPGVIARLMGLDTLPPSPSSNPNFNNRVPQLQKKKAFVVESPESVHREEEEFPEFKDVFEITEARKARKAKLRSPVHGNGKSGRSSPEVEFVRRKFAEAKRLSTDEPSRSSREFSDTIEALESNKDALIEFLSEPNALFARQLKDLTFLPPSPPRSGSQITLLKPSCKRVPGINSETCREYRNKFSNHSCEDDFVSLTFDKPIKSNYKVRGEKCARPTNIVVLKPSLDKARKAFGTGVFPVFYPEVINTRSNRFVNDEEEDSIVGTRVKSSREIARQVTRQMRRAVGAKPDHALGTDPLYEFNPLYDDNSYYASPKITPKVAHVELSVSKEARKRLSDRWKTTHLLPDEAYNGGSNTLGEMLALSDIMPTDIISTEKSRKDKTVLGINSNDGWKEGNLKNLPRSKSLLSSSSSSSLARARDRSSGHRRRASRASEFGVLRDVLDAAPAKGSLGEKNNAGRGSEEEESGMTEREIHVNSEELKLIDADEVKFGEVVNYLEDATEDSTNFDSTIVSEVKQLETETVVEAIIQDEDAAEEQEEMECTVCLKEGDDQPSPSSTLESPFEENGELEEDEASTSGCFEKISADLQELRMQLNLLKRDSTGEPGDIYELSDEEDNITEQSHCLELSSRDFKDEEERDFSYLLDMVTDLVRNASTQDEFVSLCHSLDCPVNPSNFITLEKKYGYLVLWPKSQRKILFDLINSVLSEIVGSWLEGRKLLNAFRAEWEGERFVEELWAKVVMRVKEIERGGEEMFLETKWAGVAENGVDLVGNEIENMLCEDLLSELVAELLVCW